MGKQKILKTDDISAKRITFEGWQSYNGRIYDLKNEDLARWDGCTHLVCECGNEHVKMYTCCDACRKKHRDARYEAMPFEEYAGQPVTLFDGEEYFFSEEDIERFCDDNEIDPKDLQLVVCEPDIMRLPEFDDYYVDSLPEDMTLEDVLPKEVLDAIQNLHNVIEKHKPILSWHGGKKRTKI